MALVGQHQTSIFPSPVNATGPLDANIVRSNDNIVRSAVNAHDSDTSIHIQSGLLASRPVSPAEGSVYVGTDTLFMYIFTGGSWSRVL